MEIKVKLSECYYFGCVDGCILGYIRTKKELNPLDFITIEELVVELGISDSAVRSHIKTLIDKGIVRIRKRRRLIGDKDKIVTEVECK